MLSKSFHRIIDSVSGAVWFRIWAIVGWLVVISFAHYWLNFDHGAKRYVKMGYMPVITNLAAPLLDYTSRDNEDIRFKGLKFASFAEMAESLRNGDIQVAFMIAPLSVVLRQQGEDVRVIMIGNRHESTFVANSALNVKSLADLKGKTVAVPMRYSGHNLSILKMVSDAGLLGEINIVEMNPPDMAAAMSTNSLDAYYVGEPFAAQTLKSGDSSLVNYVEEEWPRFMCNLVVVKQSFIDNNPELVRSMVQSAARAGIWASNNTEKAAKIASQYWNMPEELVYYAMTTPENRIQYDMFVPVEKEFQEMADLMLRFDLVEKADINGLIEDKFALEANLEGVTDLESIVK